VRVKNQTVYNAILRSATAEFVEHGYVKSTIGKIARRAGTSSSNIYVYFQSKLDIALAVYEPWFKAQILQLARSVLKENTPEEKVGRLLEGLWNEIPKHRNGLTTTLLQALSTATPEDNYNPELLQWTEIEIAELLSESVTGSDQGSQEFKAVAHMIMLAFDGVGLRHNLNKPIDHRVDMIQRMTAMVCAMPVDAIAQPDSVVLKMGEG
jgi:AcrR family transcriptional regulator